MLSLCAEPTDEHGHGCCGVSFTDQKISDKAMKRWTKKEIKWLKANAHLGEPGLAKALGLDQAIIRSVLRNHQIRTGNKSQFQKGMNPWNAGLHIRMSPKSEFKKGMLPANTLHDGAITVRTDKSGIK